MPFNQEWIFQSPCWLIVAYDSVYLTLHANTTNQSFFVLRDNLSAHWMSGSSCWNFCCWNQSCSNDGSQYLLRFYLCASTVLSMLHSLAHLIFTIHKELGTKSHKLVSGRTDKTQVVWCRDCPQKHHPITTWILTSGRQTTLFLPSLVPSIELFK